jgi:predicted Zn-dependent protease
MASWMHMWSNSAPTTMPPSLSAVFSADVFQGSPVEAVTVAGGPIFVPLSLPARAPSEAEFAFQLAHAIAHITQRHATRSASRGEIAQMALLLAQQQMPVGQSESAMRQGMPLGFATFARQYELEADSLACRIMAAAGFDPEAAVGYLNAQTAQPAPTQTSAALAVHPRAGQRVEIIRSVVTGLPARAYNGDSTAFVEAKAGAATVR